MIAGERSGGQACSLCTGCLASHLAGVHVAATSAACCGTMASQIISNKQASAAVTQHTSHLAPPLAELAQSIWTRLAGVEGAAEVAATLSREQYLDAIVPGEVAAGKGGWPLVAALGGTPALPVPQSAGGAAVTDRCTARLPCLAPSCALTLSHILANQSPTPAYPTPAYPTTTTTAHHPHHHPAHALPQGPAHSMAGRRAPHGRRGPWRRATSASPPPWVPRAASWQRTPPCPRSCSRPSSHPRSHCCGPRR